MIIGLRRPKSIGESSADGHETVRDKFVHQQHLAVPETQGTEELMHSKIMKFAVGALLIASPAAASHIFHPGPYPNRGACESASAQLSHEDQQVLLERFPQLFSSAGEVSSFLTRAFTCERDASGAWFLIDHRQEVIDSDWFQRRL